MTYEQAIRHFGSESELARSLGIKPPSVYEWKGGIPITRQYQIELATKGRLKADIPALRTGKAAA